MKHSISATLVTIVSVAGVGATSDFGSNNPISSSPYFYSETINVFESESDAYDAPYTAESEDFSDSASVVASSLLYEGGCLVSSQAMMCNGGDSSSFITSFDFDSDQEFSDDEDEDDDEDDGHSSMLSNASLRRSKAMADGSVSHPSNTDREPTKSAPAAEYYVQEITMDKQSSIQDSFTKKNLCPWGVSKATLKCI